MRVMVFLRHWIVCCTKNIKCVSTRSTLGATNPFDYPLFFYTRCSVFTRNNELNFKVLQILTFMSKTR